MRQATIKTLAASLALGAMLGAAPAKDDADKSAVRDPRIGDAVDRICFQRNIRNWREIRGEDNVVLLESGVNKWFRVELMGACDASVFRFAQTIAIESRPATGCVTRGDYILVQEGSGFTQRCYITDIYEWNEGALEDVADEPEEEAEDEGV